MNPYQDPETWKLASRFYEKFYCDKKPRAFLFGINPGRHGAGVTGIPFTDPIRLAGECGIANHWKKKGELSSEFIYAMIGAYGGVDAFYGRYFFTAMSPLGFVREGRTSITMTIRQLLRAVEPFVLRCIRRQLETMPTIGDVLLSGRGDELCMFHNASMKDMDFSGR